MERFGTDGYESPVRGRELLEMFEEGFAGEFFDFREDFCAGRDSPEVDPVVSHLGAARGAAFLFHDEGGSNSGFQSCEFTVFDTLGD